MICPYKEQWRNPHFDLHVIQDFPNELFCNLTNHITLRPYKVKMDTPISVVLPVIYKNGGTTGFVILLVCKTYVIALESYHTLFGTTRAFTYVFKKYLLECGVLQSSS